MPLLFQKISEKYCLDEYLQGKKYPNEEMLGELVLELRINRHYLRKSTV